MKTEAIFISSYVITIATETAAALLFRIKSARDLTVVLAANTLTNPVLNLIFMMAVLRMGVAGVRPLLYAMEAVVVICEALIYRKLIPTLERPFSFSFAANMASFLMGIFIG